MTVIYKKITHLSIAMIDSVLMEKKQYYFYLDIGSDFDCCSECLQSRDINGLRVSIKLRIWWQFYELYITLF